MRSKQWNDISHGLGSQSDTFSCNCNSIDSIEHSSFSKMNRFSLNSMNWTESPKHEYGSIIASHKHRKQFGVMVKVPD